MSNLPIIPAMMVPGRKILEDFPASVTDSYQPVSEKSDFNKVLNDAVNASSHRGKSKKQAASKNESVHSEPDSLNVPAQTANKSAEPKQQQQATISEVKEPDRKSAEAANQDTTDAETSSEAPTIDFNDQTTLSADTSRNTNSVDATTISMMLAPDLVGWPALVTTETHNETANPDVISGASGVTNVTTAVINTNRVNNSRTLDSAAMHNALDQTIGNKDLNVIPLMADGEQLSVISKNVAAQPGTEQSLNSAVQQEIPIANAAVAVRSLPDPLKTPSEMQAPQNQPANHKIKVVNRFGPGESTNGETIEALAPAADLKTGDAVSQSQSGEGIKVAANGMLPITSGKDNHNATWALKEERLDDPLVVTQVPGKNGKMQLNLPVIQTQLAVNNPDDKTREDSGLAMTIDPQQTAGAHIDTAKATVSHVNQDDLFSQIVEKAKVSIKNGNGEMEVSLKPDYLGKLHLKVSVENQLVTAKFVAESQQVKEIIETNLNQLRRNLQDTGIQVDQLLVSVGQQNNDSGFQNAFSHNSGGFTQHNSPAFMSHEISDGSQERNSQEKRPHRETVIDLIA